MPLVYADRDRRVRPQRARHRHVHRHHHRRRRHHAARLRLPDPLRRPPGAAGRRAAHLRGRPPLRRAVAVDRPPAGLRSAWRASAPARSTRSATRSSPTPFRRSGAASPSARTSAAATSAPCSSRSSAPRCCSTIGWQATLALFGIPALVIGVLLALFVREDHAAYRRRARASGSVRRSTLREVLGRRDLRLILAASLVAAGGSRSRHRGAVHGALPVGPARPRRRHGRLLYALLLVGAVVGPIIAGILSDRFGRRRTLVAYYLLSAVGILAFVAAGANLLLLVPAAAAVRHGRLQRVTGAPGLPCRPRHGPDARRRLRRVLHLRLRHRRASGRSSSASWSSAFSYPVAFGVMAASYVAAALLLVAVRERAEGAAAS